MTVIEKLENNINEVNSAFQSIKSKIVENGVEVGDELRPIEYAQKVDAVFEAGKKSEYDAFWDTYQANGGISSATYMFAFSRWNDETFKPKYSMIKITNAGNMFNTCGVTDLKAALERQNVVFDFSKCANMNTAFAYSQLTVVPIINTISAAALSNTFYGSKSLHTIEKLILKDDGSQTFGNCFYNCQGLENIVIEGIIGHSTLNLQWSTKLSKTSITSVINALSTTTTGLTVTLSKAAVQKAFETSEGTNDGNTSDEWNNLIATRNNWTISLI